MKNTLFASLFFLSLTCFSQQSINMTVSDVKETRQMLQDFSSIDLNVAIQGVKVNDENRVKIKEITSATDDKGNELKQKEDFFNIGYNTNNLINIKLEAPSRNATKIKTVTGVLKYFSPSEENGSKVTIKNIAEAYHKDLLKDDKNIKLVLLDKEKLLEAVNDENSFKKYKKELQKKGNLNNAIIETKNSFKDYLDKFSSFGYGDYLSFYIEDNDKKIVSVSVKNKQNETVSFILSRPDTNIALVTINDKLSPDWTMEILVENDKSLKEYKFSLSDIVLP